MLVEPEAKLSREMDQKQQRSERLTVKKMQQYLRLSLKSSQVLKDEHQSPDSLLENSAKAGQSE